MNILVIGCGKLGSRLAETLYRHGHDVSIVSATASSFNQLSDSFDGLTVVGMPMDMNVLRSAGVEGCDAVAVVTADDNLNITVSQIVKEFFGVTNIIARITDPTRENVFKHFGLRTVCQTNLSCDAVFSALMHNFEEKQLTFGTSTLGFHCRLVDPKLIGRNLNEVPTKPGEIIIGILDEEKKVELFNKKKETILNPKDKIIYARLID